MTKPYSSSKIIKNKKGYHNQRHKKIIVKPLQGKGKRWWLPKVSSIVYQGKGENSISNIGISNDHYKIKNIISNKDSF